MQKKFGGGGWGEVGVLGGAPSTSPVDEIRLIKMSTMPIYCRMKNVLELLDKNYHIHASLNSIVS